MAMFALCIQKPCMFNVVLFLWVVAACMWFLTPRVFRVADTLCTRQRTVPREHGTSITTHSTSPHLPEEFFDALARSLRRQTSTRDALVEHLHMLPSEPPWTHLYSQLHSDVAVDAALHVLRQSTNEIATLVAMCATHGGLAPHALDHAAHILRSQRHAQQSVVTATAQAQLTMRILTVLPFAVLVVAATFSHNMRSAFTSPAMMMVLVLGLALNRLGAWWVSRVIRHATNARTLTESVALVDALCVAVQSGHSIVDSCLMWAWVNPLGARIAHSVSQGATLGEALHEMVHSSHPFDSVVAHTLLAAQSDGLPVHSTAAMLAAESRKTQEAHFQTRVQQLPTKLSLPLVLCVLPSFGLLVVAPLLLAHLSRFGSFLPSPIT